MRQEPHSDDGHGADLDQVLADYMRRVDCGEQVDLEAIIAANPKLSVELRAYFSQALAVDRFADGATADFAHHATPRGSLEVRCPSCHAPMEVAVDTLLTDLTCSSCGSHFSLVDQSQATRMAPPLTKLGRFELIERIGLGGFGSVWKARDNELDRTVAIKIPRAGDMTPEQQGKFFREARAAAQLRHPSIVSVHEVGRDGDSVYIVSDFIRGVTLGDWLTGQKLTSREAAEICARIADALHHAHERGVVHRDLKPANIMIDGDGQPHLMDFGLARREVGEVTVTVDGQVLGTPAYMSPEQALGEGHTADRRSDVYSLGVILFQLLTGERPFRGNARMILHQVINDEPLSPRRLNANIAKDLETITLKCMEKKPARRFESAKELSDELRRFISGATIHARPISRAERVIRWIRRNKTVSAASAVAIVALAGGTVASSLFALESRRQAADALAAKNAAEAKETETAAVLDFVENKVFAAARPQGQEGGLGRDVTLRQAIEAALPFVESSFTAQPVIEARLRRTLGNSFRFLGEPKFAADQFAAARKLFAEHLSPDHPDTLTSMNYLASSYSALGRLEEALELCEETLKLQKTRLGPAHPDTLTSMNDLAASYAALGRHTEALRLQEETLALQKVKLGTDHPNTLTCMNNLATSYSALGRHMEALKLYEETLELQKAKLGPHHPDTLASMNNLTASYYALGQRDEALKLGEETLNLRKAKLGPDHPDTLTSMSNLAASYYALGQHDKALNLGEETLILQKAKLGPDHPNTLTSMNSLANSYSALDRHEEALKLYEQSLALRNAKLGSNHPDTLRSMSNLANCYSALGRREEALKLYEQTLALRKVNLGPSHPETLTSICHLAIIYFQAGRSVEASQLCAQLIEQSSFVTASSLSAEVGPEAVIQLIEVAVAHRGESPSQSLDAIVLGELQVMAGDPRSTEAAIREEIQKGEATPFVYKTLGWCLLSQGKADAAQQAFQEALKDHSREDGTRPAE